MSFSYLTTAQKDVLSNQFFNLHLTFGRSITIWRNAEQIVLSSNPANNYLFEGAPFNDVTQPVLVSGTFLARIRYPKDEPLVPFSTNPTKDGTDQIDIQKEDGSVRITVDATGSAYLFDAKKVTFDGEIFSINSTKRPHRLVGDPPNFFDYTLRKLN